MSTSVLWTTRTVAGSEQPGTPQWYLLEKCGARRVTEAAGRPRHDQFVAVVEVDLHLVLAFAHGSDAARVHMAVLPRRHDADADGGLWHIVVGGADMHLLPFDVGSRVVSLWSQGVLHNALRSDACPTVVQHEDIILVPAVVRPHPDDLDGPFVELAQEQLREVV